MVELSHKSVSGFLFYTPVGIWKPPCQVYVVLFSVVAVCVIADVSKTNTSPSEIHITPSVQTVVTPSKATTKFDVVGGRRKGFTISKCSWDTTNTRLYSWNSYVAYISSLYSLVDYVEFVDHLNYDTATLGVK